MTNIYNRLVYDYLNNNPHKFDEHGNFDASPDPRDFSPFVLGNSYGKTPKPKRPRYAGLYPPNQGPDDVAQERNRYEAADFEKGIRYDSQKCDDNWELENRLCKDGKYASGCWDRARERYMKCRKMGHYDGLPIWTFQDQTGQPQGDEDPDRSAKNKIRKTDPKPKANPKPGDNPDESKRVMSAGERSLRNSLLWAYLAANPAAAWMSRDTSPDVRAFLKNLVLMPTDYPEGMKPASPYSPPPYLSSALGAMMGPVGGPAAIGARLPGFFPR